MAARQRWPHDDAPCPLRRQPTKQMETEDRIDGPFFLDDLD
jgi:hypothetical protein